MSKEYFLLNSLQNLYLEESYVLGIEETKNTIIFKMEFVLCQNHPLYQPKKIQEQYCYRKGALIFKNILNYSWIHKNLRPSFDANKEADFGNIDHYFFHENVHHLEGSWGEIIIKTDVAPEVIYE
jgi:hypothetical protein